MWPIGVLLHVLDFVVADENARTVRKRPQDSVRLRRTCATFAQHEDLRALAYMFAPVYMFLADLQLSTRFLVARGQPSSIGQDAFNISQLVAQRMSISSRCGGRQVSMHGMHECLLHMVPGMLRILPLCERLRFVDFLAYCFSPLAGYMRAYQSSTHPQYNGIPQFRQDLMQCYQQSVAV